MIDEVVFTFSFLFPHFFDVAKVIFSWICHLLGDGTNLSRNYAFCRSISRKFHALKKLQISTQLSTNQTVANITELTMII